MNTRRVPEPTSLTLNLAPMVDVVMCLIIFFMLATKLVERENARIDLPAAASAVPIEKRELGRRVVVNILPADPGDVRYVVDNADVSLPDLARRLRAEQRRDAEVKCVVRGARDIAFGRVEAVLHAAAQAGIVNVVFAADRAAVAGPPS